MSNPELAGAGRDAEIDRLAREFPEDGAFSRAIRATADLPDDRPAVLRKEIVSAFFSRPRGRSR
jgi:hypothetical protein